MENQKYVVGTRLDTKVFNDWFAECKTKIIPYVKVVTRTKYSDVSIDCITLQNGYDTIITDNFKIITQGARLIHIKCGAKKCMSFGRHPLIIIWEDVPRDRAESAADELFDLVYSYVPR